VETRDSNSKDDARFFRITLLLLALAATAVVTPMFFLGNASGHDFQFHLSSWLDVAGQWREGVIFPRWCEWANWGFGEPRFVFYPPASWMLGAALGSVMPWKMAPGAFIWLCLVGSGLAMWRMARDWLAPPAAAAAAIFFSVNPYHLVVVYYRSDFAGLLASAFFPLMVWGAWRVLERGWRGVPALSVIFAAIWLSNAPAAVIATYSLALIFAIGLPMRRDWRLCGPAAVSFPCAFGLAAFYMLPAAFEQRWVQIGQVLSENLRPNENFLFTHANDPEFVLFNWKVSSVALGVMLVTGIAAVFAARRRLEYQRAWWTLVALGTGCVILVFPVSGLLWRFLPKLQFLQFPWRWLVPLGVVFGFMAGAATGCVRRAWIVCIVILAAIAGTATLIVRDTWWDSEDVPFLQAGIAADHGFDGTDEYTPLGCDRYSLAQTAPRVSLLDQDATAQTGEASRVRIQRWSAGHRVVNVDAQRPMLLSLRVVNYPAWQLHMDGLPAAAKSAPTTGEIRAPLAIGAHQLDLRFGRTADRTAGGIISSSVGLLLAAWAVWNRRKAAV